jgi:hypothetical protein
MNWRARAVFAAVAAVVGAYYLWGVRAAGYGFVWKQDLPGYYDHLGRAFAGGHLYLPVEPSAQLLAQPNPWDPRVDDSLKMFDAVLYHRRYYLYHGAGPAVMLFAPWRMLTHHDLPENFALFLFCFAGFLFSAGTLATQVKVKAWALAVLLLALGICQGVPFLLNRVWVYEVAVGAGYFCVSAGLFFCLRKNMVSLAAAGLMFGLAISCRPHLGIVGVFALIATSLPYSRGSARRAVAFVIPFAIAGASVAIYNYERFGNPVDFGNRYLLGGANQTEVKLSVANMPAGLYYLIASAPVFDPVFPWVRLPSPPHDFPRPAGYTVEPTVGALYLAPFFLSIVFVRRFWVPVVSAAAVLLFITATGWSTQRYEVDFLPLLVLCSLVVIARWRGYLWFPVGLAIAFGVVVNLSLAILGPNDEMIRNRPARFVKIASWFSPVERYRPVLDPAIDVHFNVQFSALSKPQRLFTAGRYELYIDNLQDQPTLISSYGELQAKSPLAGADKRVSYHLTYSSEEIRVSGDGVPLIVQKIGPLVAAPSQIAVTSSGS